MIFDAAPTEAQMLEGMSVREQETWYVTQHFNDLQGLKSAPIAAGMLLIVYLVPRGYKHWEHTLLVFAGFILFAVLWLQWISRRYKERYGLAMPAIQRQPEMLPGYLFALLLIFAVGMGCAISSRDLSTPTNMLWAAEAFFLPKCFFRVPVNFAIQLRRVLYVTGMLAVIGSVLYLTYVRTSSMFTVVYVLLWSFLVLSLYDHWLLNHLLHSRRGEAFRAC